MSNYNLAKESKMLYFLLRYDCPKLHCKYNYIQTNMLQNLYYLAVCLKD
ncbi:hypothetical protein DJ90_5854 [Paenibacillus macerans]|uniref:Uncharacterized protein n=1 Tax=Paenibacillus macerans TaxID=44252 RepID=A0A090Y9S8_PAEMA|nr:hypothetical protein DJ90_5854 [Paenibacillus macerans]